MVSLFCVFPLPSNKDYDRLVRATLFCLALGAGVFVNAAESIADGAKVTRVLEQGRKVEVSEVLQPNTLLCVYRKKRKIACGIALNAGKSGSIVALDFVNAAVEVGDAVAGASEVKKQRNRGKRDPTLKETKHLRYIGRKRPDLVLSVLTSWTLDYFNTSLQLEKSVSPHVSWGLGIQMLDVSGNLPNVEGVSLFVLRTFYSQRSFKGIFTQVGAGVTRFKVSQGPVSTETIRPAAQFVTGWRFHLLSFWSVAFSAGVQYAAKPESGGVPIGRYNDFSPLAGLRTALQF